MVRKHETLKDAPAVALGVIEKRWTLEPGVAMAEEYRQRTEEDAFEAAFTTGKGTNDPQKPKTPWYLDTQSGGPNPPACNRKRWIAYDDEL
jgi:hypothetical protein